MNREIKYKYYIVRENGFVFSRVFDIRQIELGESERWLEVNHAGDISKTLKRCQYTGLKDKNGVEIYEGDILKGENTNPFASNRINNYKVIWGRDSWHIEKTYMSLQELFNFCDVGVEVIGNIYENPELLK